MRKFDSRKWKRSESFFNYYQDKVILGNKLNLPESDLISYIIDGFDNGTLQAQARMARFISLSELLDVMKNLSITERYGTERYEASGSKKTIKCYNCHKEGHYASACQQAKKRTCFLCHEDGHMKNECPKKKPNQREPDSTTLLVEREPQVVPAYQISALFGFNEEEFSAILDTGSGISLVKCKNIPDEHVIK
ncbi:Zinc knuckle [Popillia japonica]|uniref:Zinc knuckle n=1 Tax=Popillia japonica TaxID=7064 RepID=A0AAW1HSE8_POPJA